MAGVPKFVANLFTKKNVLNAGLLLIIILSAVQIFKLALAVKEGFEGAYPAAAALESYEEQDDGYDDEDEGFEGQEGYEEEDDGYEEEQEGYEEEQEGYEDIDETYAAEQYGSWGDGSEIEVQHNESYTPLLMEPASGSDANAMFSAPSL